MAVSYTTVAPVACTAFVVILLALTILLDHRATNAEAFRTHLASHARHPTDTESSLRPTRRCVVHGKLSHPPLSQNFDPYVDYSNAELQTILDAFLRRASSRSIALAPTRLELSTRRPVRSVVDSADARLADRHRRRAECVARERRELVDEELVGIERRHAAPVREQPQQQRSCPALLDEGGPARARARSFGARATTRRR